MLGGVLQREFLPHIPDAERGSVPDYSSLLPALVRKRDRDRYWLRVTQKNFGRLGAKSVVVELYDGEDRVGDVTGILGVRGSKTVTPHADINQSLRGLGLGVLMYEVLLAHVYRRYGVRKVVGCGSDAALRVHRSLARRHGWTLHEARDEHDYTCYEYALTKGA